jgi:hypothetical protein
MRTADERAVKTGQILMLKAQHASQVGGIQLRCGGKGNSSLVKRNSDAGAFASNKKAMALQ